MRALVVSTFVSMDGVMQGPGGPAEDPSGGFAFGGWNATAWDDGMGAAADELFSTPHDLLLGRRTYEIFAAHWPFVSGDPVSDGLNAMTKHVASRTLTEVAWSGARLLPGDAGDAVAALKETDGPDLLVQGSSGLLETLFARDLVDRLSVWTFPVVLGAGKRLFADGAHAGGWTLAGSTTSSTGVVIAHYERAGDVPVGDFTLAEPTEPELRRRERLAAEDGA